MSPTDRRADPHALEPPDARTAVNLAWLVRLRWAAIAGQTSTVVAARFALDVPLPLVPVLSLIAVEAATNVGCAGWAARRPQVQERHLAAIIGVDLVIFTGLLYFTGGPTNPFSSLYLIHLALAAVAVGPRFTWALVALTLTCSAALFLDHVPLAMGEHDHAAMGHYGMHLKGMWVALGVAAACIVYFLGRLQRELVEREEELRRQRERGERHERLAGLAALAAGAAHELATPLATIAVVAKELERGVAADDGGRWADDARLIRREVDRCSGILTELSVEAGLARAEPPEPIRVRELLAGVVRDTGDDPRVQVAVDASLGAAEVRTQARLLSRALRSVLDNALDASPEDRPVHLEATTRGGRLVVRIRDHGPGMAPEVRARALDPFFTTKPPGQGMGLGLFLAASIADQLGGALDLGTAPGAGTTVTLEVPA
ncbi:MAG: HAMP domain-containing histidine kinase [Polyangiaceae bacterium]|nr:HAMP domain-containing histidine kinase [Polyangiaceae bacterium]